VPAARRPPPSPLRQVSMCWMAVPNVLINTAQQHVATHLAGMVVGSMPVFSLAFEALQANGRCCGGTGKGSGESFLLPIDREARARRLPPRSTVRSICPHFQPILSRNEGLRNVRSTFGEDSSQSIGNFSLAILHENERVIAQNDRIHNALTIQHLSFGVSYTFLEEKAINPNQNDCFTKRFARY